MLDSGAFSLWRAAREHPDRVALRRGDEALSFAQLAARTRHIASWITGQLGPLPSARGRVPTACVGVVASNEVPTALLIYTLIDLGIAFVLIPPHLVGEARAELLSDLPLAHTFEIGWHRDLPDPALPISAPVPTSEPNNLPAEAPLCIAFTAGTTGKRKATVLSRGALAHAAHASALNFGWQAQDRWLLCLPLAHLGGLSILLRCLAARQTVVVPAASANARAPNIVQIARAIVQQEVTLISFVPTLLGRLLDLSSFVLPKSVRAILIGGDALPPKLRERARARGFPVFSSYGMTEMASQVTTQRYALGPWNDHGSGPPLPGMQVRIGNDNRIEVRGLSLFSGYWQGQDLTPSLSDDGWLITPDHGRLDEHGCLHVLGRSSELLVSGGENVYPAMIERALEAHPSVSRACVFGLKDDTWGDLVCAALVGPKQVDRALVEFMQHALPPHERPRRVALVAALPETPSGKLDRRAARDDLAGQLFPLEYS